MAVGVLVHTVRDLRKIFDSAYISLKKIQRDTIQKKILIQFLKPLSNIKA